MLHEQILEDIKEPACDLPWCQDAIIQEPKLRGLRHIVGCHDYDKFVLEEQISEVK